MTAAGSWFRDTPEALRLLAIERHRLAVAEATHGLDKRQARRVRRRMGKPDLTTAAPVAAQETAHCAMCGGRGEVYDGPRITWKPCPMCGSPREER